MYNIGICDDGENICAFIEDTLLKFALRMKLDINIKKWYAGESLRDYLVQGGHLDILFLDIELFGMTGIEVGSYIRKQLDNTEMQIIYISEEASYARQLFKTQPLDFLVKPFSSEQIDDVMEMAVKLIKKKDVKFEFKKGREYYYLYMGDIVYLISEGRKIKLVTLKGTYEYYGRLEDALNNLNKNFVLIHQSYVINKEHVLRYAYKDVEMADGTILSISPAKRKYVRRNILGE